MPCRRILHAASSSRWWRVPHSGHVQWRSLRVSSLLTYPQVQVLLEGKNLSILWTVTPYFPATYSSLLTNSACARSDIFLPQSLVIPVRRRSSMKIRSYIRQSLCASSHCQALRLLTMRSYSLFSSLRLRSLWWECCLHMESLRPLFWSEGRSVFRKRGLSMVVPSLIVIYVFRPKSIPTDAPLCVFT